jgi:hypothetical protein
MTEDGTTTVGRGSGARAPLTSFAHNKHRVGFYDLRCMISGVA